MKTEAETRQSNRRLFIYMAIFALLLTVTCLLWMRGVMRSREAARAAALTEPTVPKP